MCRRHGTDARSRAVGHHRRVVTERNEDLTATIAEHEQGQVKRANASGRKPVVFIHGLWLLPSSWDRWAAAFKKAGYTTLTPGWPDNPETVEEATAHPEVFAHKSVGSEAADRSPPPS
jgi:non-heme chloroperoxidase